MHKISKLPPEIQKRICAGEVIISPYNVIKELVENSIDAGASNISVVVSKDNLNIEVHDNGCGIEENDFKNLALPHHTSKFTDDLLDSDHRYGENTLGFRGEALASIRCVSNLTIKSKTKNAMLGFVRNFKDDLVTPISMNNGTSIIIKNLFYNNKIREKCFFKKLPIFKSMHDLINTFAMKNPHIRFQFNDTNYIYDELFNVNDVSCVSRDWPDVVEEFIKSIPQINNDLKSFRSRQVSSIYNITPIRHFHNDFITLLFTPSMINFKSFQFILFINDRLVTNPNIKSAIYHFYSNILPKGRHSFVYLELRIPAKYVDVNVHPSKKEVLIEYEEIIIEAIKLILDTGLNEQKNKIVNKPSSTKMSSTDLVYKEYNTLEDCIPTIKNKEYKLLSITKLKEEIVEVDKSFIKDLVYVGVVDLPDKTLLVQYNQYLMKCNIDNLKGDLKYHYFLYNFGNLRSKPCNIKLTNDQKFIGMLKEYFSITIENNFITSIPLLGDYSGSINDWSEFCIEKNEEEEVFREVFTKLIKIYKDVEMDRNIFSIMKRDLKCTKEILANFSILKSLKDLYKCFERC